MSKKDQEIFNMDILSETENFAVWRSPDEGGHIFHVELGSITLHLQADEWEEFVVVVRGAAS